MRYVSIQQTIRYSICKISDIACGPPFWNVLVSWFPHYVLRPYSRLWHHYDTIGMHSPPDSVPSWVNCKVTSHEQLSVTYDSFLWIWRYRHCMQCILMNNYIVRSYRDVIVITKFAITKYAIRRASKAKSIVMY